MLPPFRSGKHTVVLSFTALGLLLSGCHRRPSLDETGYTAFAFAIDMPARGGDEVLAEEVAQAVLKRLDPKRQWGIACVPVASDQVEVRVQRPPDEVRKLGRAFEDSLAKLAAANVERDELVSALRLDQGRDAALEKLAGGNAMRKQELSALAEAHDAWMEGGPEVVYSSTLEKILGTNISVHDVRATLDLTEPGSPERKQWLAQNRKRFPHLSREIDEAVARHRAWRAKGKYLKAPADVMPLLRGTGVLEFRMLAGGDDLGPDQVHAWRKRLRQQGPVAEPNDTWGWFRIADPLSFFSLDSAAELEARSEENRSGPIVEREGEDWYVLADRRPAGSVLQPPEGASRWSVLRAEVTRDSHGRAAVTFELDQAGGRLLRKLTSTHIDKSLGVFVDGVAQSFANVQDTISTHGMITGGLGLERIHFLARLLDGQLPARLKFPPISEHVVQPIPAR